MAGKPVDAPWVADSPEPPDRHPLAACWLCGSKARLWSGKRPKWANAPSDFDAEAYCTNEACRNHGGMHVRRPSREWAEEVAQLMWNEAALMEFAGNATEGMDR